MKTKSQIGRRNRQKGAEFEREVVAAFKDKGLQAERIKGSGQHATGHNDVMIADKWQIECKRKSNGWGQIYKWLEQEGVDIVALRSDRKPALAVVELDWFTGLLSVWENE